MAVENPLAEQIAKLLMGNTFNEPPQMNGGVAIPTDGPMLDEIEAIRNLYQGAPRPFFGGAGDPSVLRPGNDWVPDFNGFQGVSGRKGLNWLKGI